MRQLLEYEVSLRGGTSMDAKYFTDDWGYVTTPSLETSLLKLLINY